MFGVFIAIRSLDASRPAGVAGRSVNGSSQGTGQRRFLLGTSFRSPLSPELVHRSNLPLPVGVPAAAGTPTPCPHAGAGQGPHHPLQPESSQKKEPRRRRKHRGLGLPSQVLRASVHARLQSMPGASATNYFDQHGHPVCRDAMCTITTPSRVKCLSCTSPCSRCLCG